MIELDRPQSMEQQHILLCLELEQPRLPVGAGINVTPIWLRWVVCSGASSGLLAGGESFHAHPRHIWGSSSHRHVDPSILMSTRLVH